MDKIGRNDSCPCGSGKKYKKCCITKEPIEKLVPTKKVKTVIVDSYGVLFGFNKELKDVVDSIFKKKWFEVYHWHKYYNIL